MICLTSAPTTEPYFTSWHLKGWNWRSLRSRGCGQTSATVCVYHTAHWCQTSWHSCTLSSPLWSLQTGASEQGDACGVYFHGTALHCTHTGTESKRARLVLLRSRGQERLTHVIWQRWEKFDLSLEQRCCRGQCRPEQVQPLLAYLWAPLSTKLPWSKSAESGVKNVFTIRGGQGLEDR